MANSPGRAAKSKSSRLGRENWIEAARAALIESGVAGVRIEPLATRLKVTTGSFYWHFPDRDALLAALLEDWTNTNTASFEEAGADASRPGEERFAAIIDMWVREQNYSSAYDAAMRDWARASNDVATAVKKIDRKRIALLKSIYLSLGYDADRAEVRARILYYHQVGFYALGLRDSAETRSKYRPLYVEALRDGVGRRAKR